ncbi:hypothetical protein BH24ACT26_BH24ACT26_03850 [soil metagenome]
MVARLRNPIAWVLLVVVAGAVLVARPTPSRGARARFTGVCSPTCVWSPTFRRVKRGDRVVWRVPFGDRDHNVKSRRKGSAWRKNVRLSPGERTSKVFRRRGTYFFKCTLHPGMKGKVRVRL